MKYYKLNDFTHVFEALTSDGALVAHSEEKLSKVEDINHDWYDSKDYWNKIEAINCSFFNGDGSRNGADMEDGKWKVEPYQNSPFINMVYNKSKGKLFATNSLDLSDYEGAEFVKGVCPLIKDGDYDNSKPQVASGKNPRTSIGQKTDGTIVKLVTNGRKYKDGKIINYDEMYNITELYQVMKALGCVNAFTLDSGGSSTMCINNKMVNDNENRSVVDSLIFYSTSKLQEVEEVKTVVLDAGHGLKTAGKETPYSSELQGVYANHYKEAEQNYPIMFKLAKMLEYQGIEVLMTNQNINFDMSKQSRVAIEEAVVADLFFSCHKDATAVFDWNTTRGTEMCIYKKGGQAEVAAKIIQEAVIAETGDKDRGIKEKLNSVYVLKYTDAPAVLGEFGFMTNLEDAKRMLDEEWQTKYAKGTAKGICKFLGVEWKEEATVEEAVNEATILNIKALLEGIQADLSNVNKLIDEL